MRTAPIVLVHGNPETASVWDLLAARLEERGYEAPIRLSPPGFGAPLQDGFEPSPLAYRDWLIGRLEQIGEPVDLVGHDWGGMHVALTAIAAPELLRSWATDTLGMLEPDYEWHELAQMWQRAGDGERWVASQRAMSLRQRADGLAGLGMGRRIATAVAAGFDEHMGDAILRLYRASEQPLLAELGQGLPSAAQRPGLALIATGDPALGSMSQRQRAAARAGARVETIESSSHWWMTEGDGTAGAEALDRFWRGLP